MGYAGAMTERIVAGGFFFDLLHGLMPSERGELDKTNCYLQTKKPTLKVI